MKKNSFSLNVKTYLRSANIVAAFLAAGIGALIGSQENLKFLVQDKYTYAAFLVFLFFFYFLIVEFGAVKLMSQREYKFSTDFLNNPLLKLFLLRLTLLLAGGSLVLIQYRLNNFFSYLAFAVLVAFFVGGIFETYRLLNRSK